MRPCGQCPSRSCPQGAPALSPHSAAGGYGHGQPAWGQGYTLGSPRAQPARHAPTCLGVKPRKPPETPRGRRAGFLGVPEPRRGGCSQPERRAGGGPRRRTAGLKGWGDGSRLQLERAEGLGTRRPGGELPGAPRAAGMTGCQPWPRRPFCGAAKQRAPRPVPPRSPGSGPPMHRRQRRSGFVYPAPGRGAGTHTAKEAWAGPCPGGAEGRVGAGRRSCRPRDMSPPLPPSPCPQRMRTQPPLLMSPRPASPKGR